MKWFKHMSDARYDTFLLELQRDFGHLGYAFWFKTLELIAHQGENGRVKIGWQDYLHVLGTKRAVAEQMLRKCRANGKMLVNTCRDAVEIESPKFRQFSDNYTKYGKESLKTLQSGFKETTKQEEEKKKKRKDLIPPTPLSPLTGQGGSAQKQRRNHEPRSIAEGMSSLNLPAPTRDFTEEQKEEHRRLAFPKRYK